MTEEFHKGDRVRHEDDRRKMIPGVVLEEPGPKKLGSFGSEGGVTTYDGMTRVRWDSGVEETIHVSELRHLPKDQP